MFPAGNDDDLAKRSRDGRSDDHSTGTDCTSPDKRRKLDNPVGESANGPQKESQQATAQLQSHVKDMHNWLKTAGLIADAPVEIRRHVARHYSTPGSLAAHIHDIIQRTQDHILRLDTRVTTTHFLPANPEMSDAMRPILDDICRLGRMPKEGSLDLALRAMMRFATCYRGTQVTDGCHGLGEVSTDRPADFLLRSLLSARKRERLEVPKWVKEQLDKTWTLLRGYDCEEGFFERTFDALEK